MENKDLVILGLVGIILVLTLFGGVRTGGYGCPMFSLGYGGGYGMMLTWVVIIGLIGYVIFKVINSKEKKR